MKTVPTTARWLVCSCLLAGIAAACSSSSSSGGAGPSSDAGTQDGTTSEAGAEAGPPEEGGPVTDSGPKACVPDATVSTIPVPDASLGDSGATLAECMQCFDSQADCHEIITYCNTSCGCIDAFQQFILCMSGIGTSLKICGPDLGKGVPDADLSPLNTCALSCAKPCGYSIASGKDAGGKDAGGKDGAGSEAGTGEGGVSEAGAAEGGEAGTLGDAAGE